MEFVLVLQFPEKTPELLPALEELTELLSDALGESGEFDSQEVGRGQINLFIATDNPTDAFGKVKGVLKKRGLLPATIAAFRDAEDDDYTVIWPEGFDDHFEVL